jgi:aryl-alcohol dehydrogenase-like predicted oxidoreductase
MHNFDQLTSLEETLHALDDAVRQGKVRYLAAANFSAWQVSKALGVSARLGLNGFVAVQSYYSLAGRDAEQDLLPMVRDEKLALTVWAPLAGGLLTGKFDRDGGDATARRGRPETPNFPPVDYERVHDIVDVLRGVADRHGATVAQASLAWLLAQSGVTSVTVSARRIDQLQDNLGAVDVALTDEDLAALDQVSHSPATYPTWVQQAFREARYPR